MKPFLVKVIVLSLFLFTITIEGQTKIITSGDEWLYYDGDIALKNDWYKNMHLETNNWKIGKSPLGYGENYLATKLSYGSDPNKKEITKYFKKYFSLDDPYKYIIYKLNVQRDDGVIVYLNGNEIMRNNMPEGNITNSTTANSLIFSTEKEKIIHSVFVSPDDFKAGKNTFLVSVHQATQKSSDCIFDLELIGLNNSEMVPVLMKEKNIKDLKMHIKIANNNHKQEIEKKDLEIEFIRESKDNNKVLFFIIGVLLLIGMTIFFYLWKNQLKNNIKLIVNLAEIKENLSNKERELLNLSLESVNRQQFIKKLRKNLEQIKEDDLSNIRQQIQKTIHNIDYIIRPNEDWENLIKNFNIVHSNYIIRLKKQHPSLTETELRHCIFIKLHMQTKEIAKILHIDPKSVQASRYRIKKKMKLEEQISLQDYLLKF